jgi:hypothetical protein
MIRRQKNDDAMPFKNPILYENEFQNPKFVS